MKQFAVVKKVSEVKGVQMIRHEISDGSLYDSDNCKIGCTAVVTAGRKIAKGTEVVIKRFMESKYGQSFKSMWSGKLMNPVVLVELPNGTTAWTQGQNLNLKLEDIPGYVATIEAENGKAAEEEMTKNFEDVLGKVYYFDDEDVGGTINCKTFGMLDGGCSVCTWGGKRYLADCGDVWAMVRDDWRTDTYQFLAFTKEPKLNNCVAYVSKGQPRRWDDNGGDTGIGAAIDAFEKYVAEHNGKLVA